LTEFVINFHYTMFTV